MFMCITNQRAVLEATKIISFRKKNGNVFLAYSNSVQNQSEGRNVMLLPIPGEIRNEWFYDTTTYNRFMNEIAQQTLISQYLNYGERSRGMSRGMLKGINRTTVGQYEVLYSKEIPELHDALLNAGVVVTAELLDFFADHYKGYTIVACLFDSKNKIDAQPIAFEYKPFNDSLIFYPTMDAHDGSAPKRGNVMVDHSIIVEDNTRPLETPGNVEFTQAVPDFIKEVNFGTFQLDNEYENGDFYVESTLRPDLKRSYETLIVEPSLTQ
jgi:hypothetical protein